MIAMFQKLSYFAREADVYREIAERRAVTVVGLAEDHPPELPPGVRHTLVKANHPLAREWSVTVLGPEGGATLVAVDQESLDANAHTIEEGRASADGGRSAAPTRMRRSCGCARSCSCRSTPPTGSTRCCRRSSTARTDAPGLVGGAATVPRRPHGRADPRPGRAAAELEAIGDNAAERDPRTGLYTGAFLERWTRGLGSGTLPIGLVLLRVFGVASCARQYGLRAEMAALEGLREGICGMLRPADRMIRLDHEDFLVVLPSWANEEVLRSRRDLRAGSRARPGLPVRRAARRRRGHRHQGAPAARPAAGGRGGGVAARARPTVGAGPGGRAGSGLRRPCGSCRDPAAPGSPCPRTRPARRARGAARG